MTFANVDEYIRQFDRDIQARLKQIQSLIREVVPEGTTEIISYQMPTFRWIENLIHYAQFKNHIGIYPGPDAIAAFSEELSIYNTNKGTIQIANSQLIPDQLIRNLVLFNIERLKYKNTPSRDKYYAQWVEAEEVMNQLILNTPLHKTRKWGTDVYTFNNKNVVAWGGFKDFFSVWFYNGVFLSDPYKVLTTASEGKTKSLRQWRFSATSDLEQDKVLSYILESIKTIKDGKELKPEKPAPPLLKGWFKMRLNQQPAVAKAFKRLTPGKQREYIAYIDSAKQEKTKITRLEKIVPLIVEGKGLHDKYKK